MKAFALVVAAALSSNVFASACSDEFDLKGKIAEARGLVLPPLPAEDDPGYIDAKTAEMTIQRKIAVWEGRLALVGPECAKSKLPGVRLGMSPKQVRGTNWGGPQKINRTTTVQGTTEQWVYGEGNYLYFINGKLTAIQN